MEKTIFVIINIQDFFNAKEYLERIGYNTSHLDLSSDFIPVNLTFGDFYHCIYFDVEKKYLLCKKFSVTELSLYFNIGYNLYCLPYGKYDKYENKNMTIKKFFCRE